MVEFLWELARQLYWKIRLQHGGSDLLSYVIRAYKPQYRSSTLILIVDVIVIILNVFFFKTIEVGLYSAIAIFLMGKMIDLIFEGVNFAKIILIISPNYREIAARIENEVNRGSTGLYSKGMYTDKEKMMLMCIASRNEIIRIRQIANQIDSRAFIVITNVREVYGKGFK